jgi:hypothetical protein
LRHCRSRLRTALLDASSSHTVLARHAQPGVRKLR